MMAFRTAWAVSGFEWRRAMGSSRLFFLVGLAVFPAGILWLIQHANPGFHQQTEAGAISLFVLVPEVVCLLGLLLWATPVIHSEVEGKTWPYLVVRPAGKTSILLGKYAAAVLWTMLTGWLALTLAMFVFKPAVESGHIWLVLASLVALSCIAYGALFVLLGVIFLRRAMMIAVAYTSFEFLLRMIPASVRQLTVQYHLQSLLLRWMQWEKQSTGLEGFFDRGPAWQHIAILIAYSVILLGVAAFILRRRELVAATEV